jgi:rRNA maturation protein Rpf1
MEELLTEYNKLREELIEKYNNPQDMTVTDFVSKYAELKQFSIHGVSNRRELFIKKQEEWLMVNTKLSVEQIINFKEISETF